MMSEEEYRRIEKLFNEFSALSAADRKERLAGLPDDDREALERLLAADGSGASAFDVSTFVAPRSSKQDGEGDLIGKEIGSYIVVQELGAGGMGTVYRAEQRGKIRRTVAIKVIKWGLDSREVVARFDSERQALALMAHENIARVHEVGTTETGRPYFVMEYVDGLPINNYCDKHRLTVVDRLRLFQQVCAAVQHAHQKGIIHRDLKPSNILVIEVDGVGVPKIIDFGVARATAQREAEHSVFTQWGQLVGTLEYMSPEQASVAREGVDTRSDIYSLGVLLYELLVGVRPFDFGGLVYEEMRRKICGEEPSNASTRIASIGDATQEQARLRQTDLRSWVHTVRGELDWIVSKSLEKDREHRYGTAADFASDIEHFLAHEPVLASPPNPIYRTQKFVRRHRFGVSVAAVSVLVLLAFAVTMAVQARRLALERDRANRQAAALVQSQRLEVIGSRGAAEALRALASAPQSQEWDEMLSETLVGDELATLLADVSDDILSDPGDIIGAIRRAEPILTDERERGQGFANVAIALWTLDRIAASKPRLSDEIEPLKQRLIEPFFESKSSLPDDSWVTIDGGTFLMGSDDFYEEEKPVRPVTVSSFCLLRHEVRWRDLPGYDPDLTDLPGEASAEHPAAGMTWFQAVVYATWLGGRLPTEAEWEFAAGGEERRVYPWGGAWDPDENLCDHMHYEKCQPETTIPVCGLPAGNTPGTDICDLAGNLWEWVGDWFAGGYPSEAETNPWGPIGRNATDARVIRGSAFRYGTDSARSAFRGRDRPEDTDVVLGFRVVRPGPCGEQSGDPES